MSPSEAAAGAGVSSVPAASARLPRMVDAAETAPELGAAGAASSAAGVAGDLAPPVSGPLETVSYEPPGKPKSGPGNGEQRRGPALAPGYELLGVLGRGGMGIVYKARQVKANRVVALKMILSGGHAGDMELARFRIEAEAVARLQHPGVVQVFEVGEHEGRPFLSLEYVEGGSLAAKIAGMPWAPRPAAAIMSLTFTPDGQRVVSVASSYGVKNLRGALKVWDAASGKVAYQCDGVNHCALSPDGRWLAAPALDPVNNDLKEITVWDAATGKEVRRFNIAHGYAAQMYSMVFTPDSKRLVFRGPSYSFRVWDVAEAKELHLVEGHTGRVSGMSFHRDGKKMATCGGDGMVKIWDTATWRCERTIVVAENQDLWAIAYSLDDKWLAVAGDDTLKVLEAGTGLEYIALKTRGYSIRSVAFSPDGQLLASGGSDNIIRVWEMPYGIEMWRYHGHTGPVRTVAFSPDGRLLASGSEDSTVKFWPARAGAGAVTITGRTSSLSNSSGWENFSFVGGSFSPDGRRLALGAELGNVRVIDVTSGTEALLWRTNPAKSVVAVVRMSPSGDRLASADDNEMQVRLWDPSTGRAVGATPTYKQPVALAEFSADGQWLAVSHGPQMAGQVGKGDPLIHICSAADGKIRCSFKTGAGAWALAFSRDGKKLASGSEDRSVKVWDAESGAEIFHLQGHAGPIYRLAFSPDGKRLVSGSWNAPRYHGETIIWEMEGGQPVLQTDDLFHALSDDGRLLVTAGRQFENLWQLVPFTVADARRRDAVRLFQHHLERCWLKDEVLAALRKDEAALPEVRAQALALAERYQEVPERLAIESWRTARLPNAATDAYRLALRQAEAAVSRGLKTADALTALGAALYRMERPADALAPLTKALTLERDRPATLAFLAMTQQRLLSKDSLTTLKQLEEIMKRPAVYRDVWARRYLAQAREVVLGVKTFTLWPEAWHIVGPFANPGAKDGLGPEQPPEKRVDLGAVYAGKSGQIAWQKVRRNAFGYVDLLPVISDSTNVLSYAYCELEAPADMEVDIYLGTDDGAMLWVNGAQVYAHLKMRSAVMDADHVRTALRKGRNTFLLKIANVDTKYGFYFTLEAPRELTLAR